MVVQEMRHELDRFLLTDDRGHLAGALEKERDVEAWLEQARMLSVSGREEDLVAEMRRGLDKFFARLRHVDDTPGEAASTGVVKHLVDDILTTRVLVAAHEYLNLNEQKLQDSNQQNKAMAERLRLPCCYWVHAVRSQGLLQVTVWLVVSAARSISSACRFGTWRAS